MKKIMFLSRLKKDGDLQLVEPSEHVKNSYMEKSESNLESANILLKYEKLEESVTLAYYSMYNIVTALLFKVGIKCKNHAGSIIIFKEILNRDDKYITSAKAERVDKQYYVDFNITKKEVIDTLKMVENFNNETIDFISRLNNKKIKDYREKLRKLI